MSDIAETSAMQLVDLRRKVLDGEEISSAEYTAVLNEVRQARRSGAAGAKKTTAKGGKTVKISAEEAQKALDAF